MNNKVRLGYACVNMGLTNRKKSMEVKLLLPEQLEKQLGN